MPLYLMGEVHLQMGAVDIIAELMLFVVDMLVQ
jgi:hypothetical protein